MPICPPTQGQSFNDANKRTALVSALAYLGNEGITMKRSAQLEEIRGDVAACLLDAEGLADVLFALHTASN
jgi:death-on-curing protein